MKKIVTSKLMRRCLILAVLILGLVFVASSDRHAEPAAAAPCCESCPIDGDPAHIYDWCGAICYGDPNYSACVYNCETNAYACYSRCTYCESGSGPGGSCLSHSDCPWGYYCAADNTCTQL